MIVNVENYGESGDRVAFEWRIECERCGRTDFTVGGPRDALQRIPLLGWVWESEDTLLCADCVTPVEVGP